MKKSILASAILVALSTCSYAASHTDSISVSGKDYVESDTSIVMTTKGDGYSVVNGNLTLGGANTKNIEIVSTSNANKTAGIFMKNADPVSTESGYDKGFVGVRNEIEAENIKIVTNAEEDGGLWIQGQRNFSDPKYTEDNPITEEARAKVKVKAGTLDITARDNAIIAYSWSQVDVDADTLNLKAKNIVSVRGGSVVNLSAKNANLDGNIEFSYHKQTSGTPVDGTVSLKLDGANSSWRGNSIITWDKKPSDDELNVTKAPEIALSNGATWTPTNVKATETSAVHAVDSLVLNKGVVNIESGVNTEVKTLSGVGSVNLAVDSDKTGSLGVLTNNEKSLLAVNLMDATLAKKLTADEIDAAKARELMGRVGSHDGKATVSTTTAVPEGMVNPAFGVDAEGKTHTASANTLMQSSLELASAAPLALNRIMMNDVRKRLGDIRTTEGTHGAWARYDGGKLSGEGGLENDFHTVQVGIDTVPTADSARMGVAFSYTDSDAEYARGSADMKAYSIAMYGTKVFDNGMFVDVIGRMGTADSDLTVDGQHKGTLDNVVLGVSGEFGWRFDVTNSMYIEPQAELSYAYVDGDKLTLGTAEYDVDSVNSLLGRVGFVAGLKCPSDMGNVYVRASAVHEFLGDSKITGANAGHTNVYEIDGKDTWVEYGLGANFNVTKSTYMWADVERTSGGALDEDWRATVGVRYAW